MKHFNVIQTVCASIDPMCKPTGFSPIASSHCDRICKQAKQ